MVMEESTKLPGPVSAQPPSTAEPEDGDADSATLAEIKVKKPLELLDEELGSDPYNCTGRFSCVEK